MIFHFFDCLHRPPKKYHHKLYMVSFSGVSQPRNMILFKKIGLKLSELWFFSLSGRNLLHWSHTLAYETANLGSFMDMCSNCPLRQFHGQFSALRSFWSSNWWPWQVYGHFHPYENIEIPIRGNKKTHSIFTDIIVQIGGRVVTPILKNLK